MIVPMKKATVLVLGEERGRALKKLRKLGVLHIKITEGSGAALADLNKQKALLENAVYAVSGKGGSGEERRLDLKGAVELAEKVEQLAEEKKNLTAELAGLTTELERLKKFGAVDPAEIDCLARKKIHLSLYEMPASEYKNLGDELTALVLSKTGKLVRFLAVGEEKIGALERYRVDWPERSTAELERRTAGIRARLDGIEAELKGYSCCKAGLKEALSELDRQIEFETFRTGMEREVLSERPGSAGEVAYFHGYIPAEDAEKLKCAARENAWGILLEDPVPVDDVPTKLRNNRFVSLIYPITDFLGTVPGYFEYDISGWFLGFILIFFGIIFGDGGYGLLICAAAAGMLAASYRKSKSFSPASLLVLLFGGATVLWGVLTCTWFGLDPAQLPEWLRNLSLPFISNVYADKIWYPFWTGGEAGLTTAQNTQIVCFLLALVQLTVAHIMVMIRNRRSLQLLGDLGSILQLFGIFYVVLAFVVNGQVFSMSLTIGGVPIGNTAIGLIAAGFILSFVFSNYEGNVLKSVLESCKNIVSVLLGVVNIFSDIVSYIRLWAVGLAGAAISATVNSLASPMLGDLMLILFAIILLVFGHGLNMILNILSVIVHGVRLNTLEFSTHLGMSWSGHKFKPFKE